MSAGSDKFRNRIKEMAPRKLFKNFHRQFLTFFQGPFQIPGFFKGFFRGIYRLRGISRFSGFPGVAGHPVAVQYDKRLIWVHIKCNKLNLQI